MKQLDRLLFEQGGDCFFCREPLPKSEASVEHLLAVANGGTSVEENVVACCKAMNGLLSNKPLKEKFAIVLRQKSGFRCPVGRDNTRDKPAPAKTLAPPPAPPTSAATARSTSLVAPSTRPGPNAVKAPALRAVPASPAVDVARSRARATCPTCKNSVPAAVGQVDFVCTHCKGAFRY
jgi:hypothetical protein